MKRTGESSRYGSFPTTADVGIWAKAKRPSELFVALSRGLFSLMTDLRTVRPLDERVVSVSASDPGGLVVSFLNELLVLRDTDDFLVRQATVRLVGSPPTSALATVRGERFDPNRHPRRIQVKAVTMHKLDVDLKAGNARVIVDV